MGTQFAPIITDLGLATKAIDIPANQLISNSSIDAPIFTYASSFIWQSIQGYFVPLLFALYWCVGYFFYARELRMETKHDAQNENK